MSKQVAFVIVLTVTWAITMFWVERLPLEESVPVLFVSLVAEIILVGAALFYILRVRREAGEPASWLLWLFAFGAALMAIGLVPGAVSYAARTLFDHPLSQHPSVFIVSSMLFIGVVPIVSAVVIWWHRRG